MFWDGDKKVSQKHRIAKYPKTESVPKAYRIAKCPKTGSVPKPKVSQSQVGLLQGVLENGFGLERSRLE